jgi:phosphoribosyl 1,2-cyclic phosphodiesterase
MKRVAKAAFSMILLLGSVSAMAGSKLTPEECNDYPFKPVVGEITHAQLMQELAELESVGYEPYKRDYYYPRDIEAAQARLHAKYIADCAPSATGAGS